MAPGQIGDLVQVYIKLQHEKRGKRSNTKPVLSYDKISGTVTVPGQNGKVTAAVEDIRFIITKNELALKYQEANDITDTALNESIDSITMDAVNTTDDSVSSTEPDELGSTRELKIGDEIEIYWPLDDQYYPGSVYEYSEATGKHRIAYDGGQVENVKIDEENWCILTKNEITTPEIASIHKEALQQYFKPLAHKEFMLQQLEGLPPHPI